MPEGHLGRSLIITGLACLFAAIVPTFAPELLSVAVPTEAVGLAGGAAIAGAAAAGACFGTLPRRYCSRAVLSMVAVIGALAGGWALLVRGYIEMPVVVVCSVLMGLGWTAGLFLWCGHTATRDDLDTPRLVAYGGILGSLIGLGIQYIQGVPAAGISMACAVTCVAVYWIRAGSGGAPDNAALGDATTEASEGRQHGHLVDSLLCGICLGFAVAQLSDPASVAPAYRWMMAGTVGVASMAVLIDSVKTHWISAARLRRWSAPWAAVALFPMPFFGVAGRAVCSALLLLFCLIRLIVGLSQPSAPSAAEGPSFRRTFGSDVATLMAGGLAGSVLRLIAFDGSKAQEAWAIFVSFGLISLIVLYSASTAGDRMERPIREVSDRVPGKVEQDGSAVTPGKGMWRRRCTLVAERYSLSPREEEVLSLLAKGRNTEYIQKELSVSSHTVKAHVYNIYRKLGIHSRHELMDIIEGFDIPPR